MTDLKRYRVHVEDDFIHASNEDEARAILIATLTDDGGLIAVTEEPETPA